MTLLAFFKAVRKAVGGNFPFISEAFHIPVSAGSMHPFGIGTSALHQFISTIKSITATGYGSPAKRFVDDNCFIFKNGEVRLVEKPGLGITVNEAKLEKYTTRNKEVV